MNEEESFQSEKPVEIKIKTKRRVVKLFSVLVLLGIICTALVVTYIWLQNQPTTIDWTNQSITVEEGETVKEIAKKFKEANLVNSNDLLYIVLATQFDATKIKASRYVFSQPLTTIEVAERLIAGDFNTDLQKLTIIEGESRHKIAERLSAEFDFFETEEFLLLSEGMEGTLFPETYFIPKSYTTEQLVYLLNDAFHDVMDEYSEVIELSPYTETEVVILASIVEREANTEESMKYVAGIFANRLGIGMALQADATIEYVLDEGLNDLAPGQLAENLRELDSPYNTYLYRGLPPTPIGNPGRAAIEAVLFPITSDYFYYITGDDGKFYYAETYAQHLRNIANYLK